RLRSIRRREPRRRQSLRPRAVFPLGADCRTGEGLVQDTPAGGRFLALKRPSSVPIFARGRLNGVAMRILAEQICPEGKPPRSYLFGRGLVSFGRGNDPTVAKVSFKPKPFVLSAALPISWCRACRGVVFRFGWSKGGVLPFLL